ncbi:hypothetical protein CGCVW01_v013753 [Colletotrichum viniferum]|nr:hypothetical protein CGCVW01_v013753 [Colletotrichum viniferum]
MAPVASPVIHFNPTYGQLDDAVHIAQLAELVNKTRKVGGQRRITRRQRKETDVEPDQITVKTGDTRLEGVISSVKVESKAVAEDLTTSEVVGEDVDAPHEIEADSHVVIALSGEAPDAQQVEAPSSEESFSSAALELPTETAKFSQDVCETEYSIVCGTETANAPIESEGDSFVDLLELGFNDLLEINDLLEMETDGADAPSGSVDNNKAAFLGG